MEFKWQWLYLSEDMNHVLFSQSVPSSDNVNITEFSKINAIRHYSSASTIAFSVHFLFSNCLHNSGFQKNEKIKIDQRWKIRQILKNQVDKILFCFNFRKRKKKMDSFFICVCLLFMFDCCFDLFCYVMPVVFPWHNA